MGNVIDIREKCKCAELGKYSVDTVKRVVTCECGKIVDSFDAITNLFNFYEKLTNDLILREEKCKEMLSLMPRSAIFGKLEELDGEGTMIPYCPNCNQPFEFGNLTVWSSKEFLNRHGPIKGDW